MRKGRVSRYLTSMKCPHISSIVTQENSNGAVWLFRSSSRHNKSMKIKFPVTLMVYHRKIGTSIKKQNALANWVSIKDLSPLKSAFKNIISKSVYIVEAKPVKPRIT